MKEIDERLKKLGLAWNWDKDRECLDLIYNFGDKKQIDSNFGRATSIPGQVGCIFKLSEDNEPEDWKVSIWNNCYNNKTKKRIDIEGFGYYESNEASLELAKFKAELVMMDWVSVK